MKYAYISIDVLCFLFLPSFDYSRRIVANETGEYKSHRNDDLFARIQMKSSIH